MRNRVRWTSQSTDPDEPEPEVTPHLVAEVTCFVYPLTSVRGVPAHLVAEVKFFGFFDPLTSVRGVPAHLVIEVKVVFFKVLCQVCGL